MVANVNITPAQSPKADSVVDSVGVIHVISDVSDFFHPAEQEEEGRDSSENSITGPLEPVQQEVGPSDDECPTKAFEALQIEDSPPIRVKHKAKKKGNKLRGITVSNLGKGDCSLKSKKRKNHGAAHPPPSPNRPYVPLPGQDTPDAWRQISAPPRPVIAREPRIPDGEWQVQGRRRRNNRGKKDFS